MELPGGGVKVIGRATSSIAADTAILLDKFRRQPELDPNANRSSIYNSTKYIHHHLYLNQHQPNGHWQRLWFCSALCLSFV